MEEIYQLIYQQRKEKGINFAFAGIEQASYVEDVRKITPSQPIPTTLAVLNVIATRMDGFSSQQLPFFH
jgi:hypothetical protein